MYDGTGYDDIPLLSHSVTRNPTKDSKSILPQSERPFHDIAKGCVAIVEPLVPRISTLPPSIPNMIVCPAVGCQKTRTIGETRVYQIVFPCNLNNHVLEVVK